MRILAVLIACLFALPASAADKTRPNICFILTDDLGIDDLGCYGRKEHLTPNLDKLESEGMRFICHYCAQPICSPARAAILTGKAPARLHLTTYLPGRPDCPSQKLLHPQINRHLPLEEETLAEYLKQAGYATACIGKWHLGGGGFGPKQQGFDFVHAGMANTRPSKTEGGKGEYDLTRSAIDFIERNKSRPFFLYLAHNTPHIPLGAKPALIEKYKDAFNPTYAAMMETLDDTVGLLLAKLKELKLADNTIVIFTSDNGGLHVLEFPDSPSTHNTPYRAGKGFLYEGGLRVPLIIRWPGVVAAGKVSNVPVIQMDFAPTILDACGLKPDGPLDGTSVLPLLKGEKLAERTLYWHFPHYTNQGSRPGGAIRKGRWKLVDLYEDESVELYDLVNDPQEEHNLAAREPEKAKALRDDLIAWRKDVLAQENTLNPDFDAALHKKLYEDVDVSKLKAGRTAAEMRGALRQWRDEMDAVIPKKKKKG